MGVAVQQNIPRLQRRQVGRVVPVAVGGVDEPLPRCEHGIVGQNGKFQHHLVHLGIAVAAHAENAVPARIEQGQHLLGGIRRRQVVARAVVQNIAQQKQPVRALAVPCVQQAAAAVRRAVDVRCNEQLHRSSPRILLYPLKSDFARKIKRGAPAKAESAPNSLLKARPQRGAYQPPSSTMRRMQRPAPAIISAGSMICSPPVPSRQR